MSAIEKIWGTHEQYRELRGWLEENKPEYLVHMGWPSSPNETGMRDASIALFPAEADQYLMDNYPNLWLIDQIIDQYGGEPII